MFGDETTAAGGSFQSLMVAGKKTVLLGLKYLFFHILSIIVPCGRDNCDVTPDEAITRGGHCYHGYIAVIEFSTNNTPLQTTFWAE